MLVLDNLIKVYFELNN